MSHVFTVTFLGTGAAVPTTRRGMPAVAIRRDSDLFLLDCGEGTQRQILSAGLPPSKISTIFISHLHGDHVLGIPGFVSTQQMMERRQPLTIIGPQGIADFMGGIIAKISAPLSFPLSFTELDVNVPNELTVGAFTVKTQPLVHKSPCLGFRFIEKEKRGVFDSNKAGELGIPEGPVRSRLADGEPVTIDGRLIKPNEVVGPPVPGRVIAYCTDTRPCDSAVTLADHADLFICDSTFVDEFVERAILTYHATSREAAQMARAAGAKKLVLCHYSSRLGEEGEKKLLLQAQEVFPASILAQDFDQLFLRR